jgi:TatA/E family protein of Tat protein translocase
MLLFGANRLPELMRSLGRSVTEFKKGIQDGSGDDEESKKIEKP